MLIENIRKRDGRIVLFDSDRIQHAIQCALDSTLESTDKDTASQLTLSVIDTLESENKLIQDVEHVQDVVENTLIDAGLYDTAKAYIVYRSNRNRSREMKSGLMQIYQGITFQDSKDNDIKRENANIDGNTAMGMMLKYGSEGSKQFYMMNVMKPDHAQAHREGDIHIHDMDFAPTGTTTCTQIDLLRLFKNGFSTGHGALREPQDISSYSALACIAIQSNQNCQHNNTVVTCAA